MRIINKRYLLIMLLIGVILTGVIVFKPKENVKLDNVILKQEVNNKTFAMYKEEGKSYVPVEGTKFPEMYVLNLTESKCIDNNGNELSGVLSYGNGNVTLTSGNTTYCYLYFDKSLGLEIKEKNPNGLKTDKERGAMYRFQGQAKDDEGNELVDNYICFGTSDKDTCVKHTDQYMYRIIGIEAETGRVKVIKKDALKKAYQWWEDYNHDIVFPKSKIFETLNGNVFLGNTNYVPVDEENNIDWEEKISNNTWIYGDMFSSDAKQSSNIVFLIETGKLETQWNIYTTKDTLGAQEQIVTDKNSPFYENTSYYIHKNDKWSDAVQAKISLMYIHDYYYSISDDAICEIHEDNYGMCQTSWIHLSQNDLKAPVEHEWIMSRFGFYIGSGYFGGYYIRSNGAIADWGLAFSNSIRPVFYINASEELLDGEGTLEDPFIIKE